MELIKDLFTSKKFLATLAGIVVSVLAAVGFEIETEIVLGLLLSISAYVVGQGIADNGKEAEKEKAKKEATSP
jgi:hypothetical protein